MFKLSSVNFLGQALLYWGCGVLHHGRRLIIYEIRCVMEGLQSLNMDIQNKGGHVVA
jgi:hypothetical protein